MMPANILYVFMFSHLMPKKPMNTLPYTITYM